MHSLQEGMQDLKLQRNTNEDKTLTNIASLKEEIKSLQIQFDTEIKKKDARIEHLQNENTKNMIQFNKKEVQLENVQKQLDELKKNYQVAKKRDFNSLEVKVAYVEEEVKNLKLLKKETTGLQKAKQPFSVFERGSKKQPAEHKQLSNDPRNNNLPVRNESNAGNPRAPVGAVTSTVDTPILRNTSALRGR